MPTSNKTDSFSILDLFYVKIKFLNERNCSKKRCLIKIWYKIGRCSLLTSCQRWWKMSEFRAGFLQHLHKVFGDIDALTYLKPPDFTNRQILTPICGYGKEMFLHHWHISIGRSTCIYRKSSIKPLFFQAEDGIRDVERSRGLGDVYKRQDQRSLFGTSSFIKEFNFDIK